MGWKGFEDMVATIPGATVDIVQKVPGSQDGAGPAVSTLREWSTFVACGARVLLIQGRLLYNASEGTVVDDGGLLLRRMHIYGDRYAPAGWEAEYWCVRPGCAV
ncbi:uncharacterized protein PHACADRAFT_248141 [Phanerochaete carnosa HHB-10118-sp]|uniref:Uncharacterized protein n=1 Tax=Phanerochaete carnosa (strain HHB-10118-sp) TaxID=650164 RepID=K5WQH0_PHACS|nr:uncharacterized protein PHACADRAFT_248141 [Phanerochaete carnosa HHB-10118-sp]EKM61489.1 hypothetical protein PHACADRAFT_248141 [Phanerochaete carnosa HHB-10118-sp]